MSAPPYMKLYVADYLGDTHHLGALEHGAYLLLLMAMWRAGGTLPAMDKNLAKLARCTLAEWDAVKDTVLAMFKRSRGKLTHKRLSAELAKYENTSGKRSVAGKRGAVEKANKTNAAVQAIASDGESNCRHNQNQNHKVETPVVPQGDEGPSKAIRLSQADVEGVWSITPQSARTRTSRADVLASLQAAARRGRPPSLILAGLRAYYASPAATKDNGQFAKGAHRMIDKDRYLDFLDQAPSPVVAVVDPWPGRLSEFGKNRYWNTVDWGPAPGKLGSRFPAEPTPEPVPKDRAA